MALLFRHTELFVFLHSAFCVLHPVAHYGESFDRTAIGRKTPRSDLRHDRSRRSRPVPGQLEQMGSGAIAGFVCVYYRRFSVFFPAWSRRMTRLISDYHMTRHSLREIFYIAVSTLFIIGSRPALGQESSAQSSGETPPNVLLILADDLGSLDLNCYGAKDLQTPNLDRLARRGVRFTQFYAAAPVCSPSRAALLTGKTNLGAGLPGNVPVPEKDPGMEGGLPSSEVTIAEMLKESGYYTALVGKWHLGHAPDKLPTAQG